MSRRLAAALLLLFATAATAQQPSRLGETIDVSIVNVDVIVTDRAGNRVRGLTQDDFLLTENGQPRAITNFAEYRSRSGDFGPSVAVDTFGTPLPASAPPPRRSIVLFVDSFALPRFDAAPMFTALRAMVASAVREGDVASIVAWRPISDQPVVVVPYTSDARKLVAALEQLEEASTLGSRARDYRSLRAFGGGGIVAPDVVNLVAGPRDAKARQWARREEGLPPQQNTARLSPRQVFEPESLDAARFLALQELSAQKRKAGVLRALIASMGSVDGRKALILATHRLSFYAGGEYFYALGYSDVPPHDRTWLDTRSIVDSVITAANANGVTIYPIYPEGLGTLGAMPNAATSGAATNAVFDYNVLTNETSTLANIAVKTGGMMAWGAKDVVTLLPRIAEDLDSYYSLAYRSSDGDRDPRRAISVKAKNPDYIVRARREYAALPQETKVRNRVTAAVFREPDGMPRLDVRAAFGKPRREANGTYLVPLRLRIPMAQLVALAGDDGKRTGSFSVYIASAATLGTEAEITKQTQPFSYAEAKASAVEEQLATYEADIRVDRASQYIAVGVVDDVSRESSVLRLKLPRR